MDYYRACGLVEGFEFSDDEDEVLAAWQFLVDTGLVWRLQGRFGRTAADMIRAGILSSPMAAAS